MSQNPYLTHEDFHNLKDASRYYLDYMLDSGVRKDAPKLYEDMRTTNLRLMDFVQFWDNYTGIGDQIELNKPNRQL